MIIDFFFSSQWPSKTLPSTLDDQSTNNNNNSKACTAIGDDSNNKCPICFMIFPLTMTHVDRNKHVDEHMIDDQDAYNIRM